MSFKKDQRGFGVIEIVIIVAVLGAIGFMGWRVLSAKKDSSGTSQTQSESSGDQKFIWQQTATGWKATSTAPECAKQPMLKMPADITKITGVLYPGQVRGSYKPHGGFRFDNSTDNAITVTAPMDGFIVKGSRYLAEGTTEIQYGFDIMNNCGVMYRLGHLRELPANLQQIAEGFPAATTSSQNHQVNPPVVVKQGDVMATKVGLITQKNTFFDWGVYDYRTENEVSKSAAYRAAQPQGELSWHAVCWLQDNWLPTADQSKLASLPPGDPASGKKSDYCK